MSGIIGSGIASAASIACGIRRVLASVRSGASAIAISMPAAAISAASSGFFFFFFSALANNLTQAKKKKKKTKKTKNIARQHRAAKRGATSVKMARAAAARSCKYYRSRDAASFSPLHAARRRRGASGAGGIANMAVSSHIYVRRVDALSGGNGYVADGRWAWRRREYEGG